MNRSPAWPDTLEGPSVLARPLAEADLPFTLEWRNQEQSRHWFKVPDVIDNATHYAWFRNYVDSGREYMFMFVSRGDGMLIGQGGIYAIDEANGRAEVGRFVSAPAVRGRGLFREGLTLLLEFARSELALRDVWLEVMQSNVRAISLYRSLGFLDVGCARSMLQMRLPLDGQPSDRHPQADRAHNA